MEKKQMERGRVRRRTLLAFGCGVACQGLVGCGGAAVVPPIVAAGAASDVAINTLRAVPGAPAAIGRDGGGIFSISLVCTHSGCDISQDGSVTPSRITCDCHNSIFDGQGNVLRGPARSALPHLAVTVDAAGQLTIHGDQVVPASTRLTA
jgi:nitrite reductase/ring-hydroxylating ferredoxin subunit